MADRHIVGPADLPSAVRLNASARYLGVLVGPAVGGLFNMAGLGMRAFSGITVGLMGPLIGVHWSLALSAVALIAVIAALLARFVSKTAAA